MAFDVDAYYGSATSPEATIDAAFAEAERWLAANAGGYDVFISLGSLDCHQSIQFLENAIGVKFGPADGRIWLGDDVSGLAAKAVWPDQSEVPDDVRWAYWSARKFLEVCVTHGLGIWTS